MKSTLLLELKKPCLKTLFGLTVFLLLQILVSHQALAQEQNIQGKITNGEDGSGLPGVSVFVKGTTKGTVTDINGTYQLAAAPNATLVYSAVGMTTQEVAIGSRNTIDLVMRTDNRQLSEVVVTALGVKKDVRAIGVSIQSLDGAAVTKAREPNPVSSLVGKIAGLTIGSSTELLRRPNISLRGNSDVLFVVDGVPINSDTWNLSPDDIETYSVLKGASASALYGFRGKNGAILITTKRGTKDARGFSVEFNSSTMTDNGFLSIPKVQDLYGPGDHGQYAFKDGRGGGVNDGDYDVWGPRFEGQLIPQYDSPIDPVTGKRQGTPWLARGKDNLKRFIQPGILSTNNLAIASSNDKYDMRFSMSHTYQKGIVPNTQLNSTTFKINSGYNFTNRLRFEGDVQYNRQYTPNFPDANYGPNSLIYNMVIWGGADWDVDDMKKLWQPGKEGVQQIYAEYQRYNNPWFVVKEWLRGHYKTDVIAQTALKYNIADGLDASIGTQISTWNMLRTEKLPYSATSYGREEARGDYREDRRNLFDNNTQFLLKYNKQLSEFFSLNALAGANMRIFNYNSNYASTNYLNVPGVYNFANSANPGFFSNFNSDMRVVSSFYSADFGLKNFLTLSTTGRVDKLSTLPKGNNTFFYPSAALSTVISDFVKMPNFISFFKLRSSYANVKDAFTTATIGATPGVSFPVGYGQQYSSSYDGPTYQNSAVYSTPLGYNNNPYAVFANTLNNPNIKPNSTSQTEFGLDIRFLKNRLIFDAAYFISNDGPAIFTLPISETTGFTGALQNGIKTQKKGAEFSLTGLILKNQQGLNWEILMNWATFKQTLTEIYPGQTTLNTFLQVGDRIDKYYGSAFIRTPDGQLINDAGGRPIQNPRPQYLGNTNADYVWGINNRFSYKSFTFSFQFDGRVGGVIQDYVQRQAFRGGRHIETVEGAMGISRLEDTKGVKSYLGDGVQISNGVTVKYDLDGKITNYAEMQFKPNETKQFLQDYISRRFGPDEFNTISRTFSKLREVVIGYTLPSNFLDKVGVKQASISFVGRNLLYFAEKHDMDIEQYITGGGSDLQTPTTRRYGVNLNFIF